MPKTKYIDENISYIINKIIDTLASIRANAFNYGGEITVSGISQLEPQVGDYYQITDTGIIDNNTYYPYDFIIYTEDGWKPMGSVNRLSLYTPTLDHVPTSSDLSYTNTDGNTVNFFPGNLVRYNNSSNPSSYDFYILSNISNNSATWIRLINSSELSSPNYSQSLKVTDSYINSGHYSDTSVTNAALILGNGTSTTPHNALVVDWNGNLTTSGNVIDGNGHQLSKKATLNDVLVDGKVILWNATTQKLETATTDQLRNLLMWIGTESELRTLVSNSGLEEGKLYATLDNSYFS